MFDAMRDSNITETLQKPNVLLKFEGVKLQYQEKFYRISVRPIFKIMFEDFNADLDELIATKTMKKKAEPKITIDEFCNHFMKIHPWNDPVEMDGPVLNMRKLLIADRDSLKDHNHPGHGSA